MSRRATLQLHVFINFSKIFSLFLNPKASYAKRYCLLLVKHQIDWVKCLTTNTTHARYWVARRVKLSHFLSILVIGKQLRDSTLQLTLWTAYALGEEDGKLELLTGRFSEINDVVRGLFVSVSQFLNFCVIFKWIDHGHWYDKKDSSKLELLDVHLLTAMSPASSGRSDISARYDDILHLFYYWTHQITTVPCISCG